MFVTSAHYNIIGIIRVLLPFPKSVTLLITSENSLSENTSFIVGSVN
jgi:hypothetical protein